MMFSKSLIEEDYPSNQFGVYQDHDPTMSEIPYQVGTFHSVDHLRNVEGYLKAGQHLEDFRSRLTLDANEVLNWVQVLTETEISPEIISFLPSFVKKVKIEDLRSMSPLKLIKRKIYFWERFQCGLKTEPLFLLQYPDGLCSDFTIHKLDMDLAKIFNHEVTRDREGCFEGIPVHVNLSTNKELIDELLKNKMELGGSSVLKELDEKGQTEQKDLQDTEPQEDEKPQNSLEADSDDSSISLDYIINFPPNPAIPITSSTQSSDDDSLSSCSDEISTAKAQSVVFLRPPMRRVRRSMSNINIRAVTPPTEPQFLSDSESDNESFPMTPSIKFSRRYNFSTRSEWMFKLPEPVKGGTVPAPLFARRDLGRSHRMSVIVSSWVGHPRATSAPPTMKYQTAPANDVSWRNETPKENSVSAAHGVGRRFQRNSVDEDTGRCLTDWRYGAESESVFSTTTTKYTVPLSTSSVPTVPNSWREKNLEVAEDKSSEDWEVQRRKQSGKKSIAQLKPYREFGDKGKSGVYHDSWLRPDPITPPAELKPRKWLAFNKALKDMKSIDDYADNSSAIDKKGDTGEEEKPGNGDNISLSPNKMDAKNDKTFTTLTSTVDFDPFGALPGDKERKKGRKKKESAKSIPQHKPESPPNLRPSVALTSRDFSKIDYPRPATITEDVEMTFNPPFRVSSGIESTADFPSRTGNVQSVNSQMAKVALVPPRPLRKCRIRSTAFDPGFFQSTESRDDDEILDESYDNVINSRCYYLKGARFYCGRMSAPRVTTEGSYPMVGAANHLYGMPEDLPTELSCVTCDRLPSLTKSKMKAEVGKLIEKLGLTPPISQEERDYLEKLVQLDRALKIRVMNNFSNCPFGGEQLDAMNRRFLEALHNYYMAMGLNLGRSQQQPGYPWVHVSYTEHMNFLNAGIKALEFSPLNPSRGGCLGKPSPADGGHSAGKCGALDKSNFYMYSPGTEIFSRKVFVGGVPSDIDEEALLSAFRHFGKLSADWPNRSDFKHSTANMNGAKSRSGYVFIVYEKEHSVHALRNACIMEDDQYFMQVMNIQQQPKLVQVRPWMLAEADYVVQPFMHINLRSAIFIGGVPRPIRAVELAHMIDELYGNVVMAGIDTDLPLKYPKGAGRVVFSDFHSYMRAITDKYVRLQHGDIDKVVEIKPYVLDDQPCDECRGQLTDEKAAPFFCPHPECLQYYCENCWGVLHRSDNRADHRPLIKEA